MTRSIDHNQSQALAQFALDLPVYPGYKPLSSQRREIRLLEITSPELTCTIRHASIDEQTQYSALSYYWGAPGSMKIINLNGIEVPIRKTLHQFLKTLCRQLGPLTVWLDVICINQQDVTEQSSQVAMMGEIYQRAMSVYAWLGKGTANTDYAINYLHQASEDRNSFDSRHVRAGIKDMFLHQYWTRVWVNQEYLLNHMVYLVCGAAMIELDKLVNTEIEPANLRMSASTENFLGVFGNAGDERAAEQRLWHVKKARNAGRSSKKPSLLELVLAYSDSNCQDAGDKFYGFRALANDGDRLMVDYSLEVDEIMFQALSIRNWTSFIAWSVSYVSHDINTEKNSPTWWAHGAAQCTLKSLLLDAHQISVLLQIQLDQIPHSLADYTQEWLVLPVQSFKPPEVFTQQARKAEMIGLQDTDIGELVSIYGMSTRKNVTQWQSASSIDFYQRYKLHFDIEAHAATVINAAITATIGSILGAHPQETISKLRSSIKTGKTLYLTKGEQKYLASMRVFRSITRGHIWVCRVTQGVHVSRFFLFLLVTLNDANWQSIPDFMIEYGHQCPPSVDRRCTCVMPAGVVSPHPSPWAVEPTEDQPSA